MRAILSDIHANACALEAVLEDINQHDVSEIICLGDVIGYGPEPKRCIDLAMDFNIALQGNHEQALLVQMEGATFNVKAKSSIDWTRQQLDMLSEDREENRPRWDFLGGLREYYEQDEMCFVHGSPRDYIAEYIYPRDIYRPDKLQDVFSIIERVCFLGHTHVPGVWTDDMVYMTPKEVNYYYQFTEEKKTLVNVGSVGQPRDGDLRASYVLLEGDEITFRKVSYPLKKTVEKIRNIPELDPFLAERLLQGR
ncbi:MAG: metallophosphoesterase family protein [Candidatus Brocadiia bacterium]